MPRAIYQKAIYRRPNQLTRAVYQRKNNVIPVEGSTYIISSVTLLSGGKEYAVSDELTVEGGIDDVPGIITVKSVTPTVYQVTAATPAGTMADYVSGETITILGGEGDTPAVLTITAEDGVITALEVTEAGSYAEDISGEISTYTYEGSGTGLELTVTAAITDNSGSIESFDYTNGSYTSDLSGEFSLLSATGSGASFNVTMVPEIIGDDEDFSTQE